MPRAVLTGAAGFLGSALSRALVNAGWEVLGLDNMLTGRVENVDELLDTGRFSLTDYDVTNYLHVPGDVDAVLHFASPASPRDYLEYPIKTLKVGSLGTHHALGLAKAKGARFLLASTSEVYGDPQVHPQPETYWGHVNPVGPRGVYDEAKRFAEAMAMAYQRSHGIDVKVARIFNTYGPRLRPADGRAIPNFLSQAVAGDPLTVYGDGTQTRSFCYIDDEVEGLLASVHSAHQGPMNIGNPDEFTVRELAELVLEVTGSRSEVVTSGLPENDPVRRRPDITLAETVLGWKPRTGLREGLERTVAWFKRA